MKFKMKQMALLLAGLSTSAVTIAAPVTVAQIDAARSNGTLQQAWFTGASAPTITAYAGWVRGCDLNTNTMFSTNTSSNVTPGTNGDFNAYACTRGGVVSVLYHTRDGGSLNAYTPHTVGSVLARIKFVGTGSGCNPTPLQYTDSLNPNNNATVFKSCALVGASLPASGATPALNSSNAAALLTDPNAPQWPLGGLSDVEGALFPNSIGGGDVGRFGTETDVGVGQAFAVIASIPLYRAMQAAQGITVADPNFAPENAPNITSAQYAGIISPGGEKTWSSIVPGSTNEVILARRVDTSGTQASSDAFFLRNPCNAGVGQQLSKRTRLSSEPGVIEVLEGSSGGAVYVRVTTASNSTDPKKSFAIGVASAEGNWRTSTSANSNGYRVLKVDGVHPETGDTDFSRLTTVNGHYKFHMELKSFVRADYAGKPPKTAFEARIMDEVVENLKNPPSATCAVFPRGLTLNPINESECVMGVQVARMTNQGKNCATPIQFY